jgi:hypothetical protein
MHIFTWTENGSFGHLFYRLFLVWLWHMPTDTEAIISGAGGIRTPVKQLLVMGQNNLVFLQN